MVGLPDQSLMLLFGRRRGRAGGAKRTRRAHASARTAFSSFPAELRARPVLALWLQQQTGHQVLPCMTTLFQHIVVRRGSTTGYPVISSCARVRVWVPPTAHLTAAAALQLCQYAVMAQAPRSKEKTRCITNHGKDHECATPHTTPLSLGLHWPPMPCHAHCHVYRPAGMSCTWLQYGGGLHDVVSMKRRRAPRRAVNGCAGRPGREAGWLHNPWPCPSLQLFSRFLESLSVYDGQSAAEGARQKKASRLHAQLPRVISTLRLLLGSLRCPWGSHAHHRSLQAGTEGHEGSLEDLAEDGVVRGRRGVKPALGPH